METGNDKKTFESTRRSKEMNRFDPKEHKYYINDIEVPGHTSLLPDQDFFESKARLEELRQEGQENHALIKMFWDTGETFDDPMLIALEEWYNENKGILGDLLFYEKPLFSEKYMFAGKPDTIFSKAIVEFKRSFINKYYHALQIALQLILSKEMKVSGDVKRWIVAWYDGSKFQSRNVYNPYAKDIAIGLIKRYHIDQATEKYLKGEFRWTNKS